MAKLGVIPLDPIGLALVEYGDVDAGFIAQCRIGRTGVTVVQHRLGRTIQHRLPGVPIAGEGHCPPHDATGGSLDEGEDVGFVFLSPMKVYNSSCSTTFTSAGRGGVAGKVATCALTQLITV